MKIETMMRALTMAQLAWHHPGDYRMRTRLDWWEMVQRIFAGIQRRYTALQAENTKLRDEVDIWERKSKNNGLAAMIGLERMNELQAENARLRDELAAKDTDHA